MVKIPYIKIPSVRVGSIVPTSNIGTGGATPAPPTPITYLTQWKIVGNSEVHTLPYPDGVVLPTGYKRCEYLQFHGTEYIDSGIIPEQGIEVKTKYLPDTDGGVVFGTINSAWSRDSLYIIRTGTPRVYSISYGGKVTDNMSSVVEEVEININSQSVKFNNTTIPITSTIIKGQNNLYIGGVNGLNLSYCYIGKIYFFKLSLNGADIFNGIPCLDANDVPCFYDIVSQTAFYNQGSGSFTYELYPQPTEIWSCGEYNPIDGKWHILVQPQGGSIADIALTKPLRKVNDVADTIEFPCSTEGKALVTRNLNSNTQNPLVASSMSGNNKTCNIKVTGSVPKKDTSGLEPNLMCDSLEVKAYTRNNLNAPGTFMSQYSVSILVRNSYIEQTKEAYQDWLDTLGKVTFIYQLGTPTTELVDVPQIEEADSYTCVISQGAKAVSWSDFLYYSGYLLTDSENNILVDSENYQLTVQS